MLDRALMPSFPPSLPIRQEVLAIAERLSSAGHAVWCVGGAVRDNLLGESNKDFDLATSATPKEVRKLFKRSIPVGIEHGTVAVLDRNRQPHEVTTFRKDIETDGRHAVVEFGVELEEDLARRDFTINAIAYQPLTHEWRDPHDGKADLDAGLIRAVGDPHTRFQEDYLRILRMLRFAARFDFRIDQGTWDAAKANIAGLEQLSAERVREEWMRGLASARRPSRLVELWGEVGAVQVWLPEVRGARSADSNAERGTRTRTLNAERGAGSADSKAERGTRSAELQAIELFAERDPVLMTAYLSSDPAAALTRLRCSNADIERGRAIGEHRGNLPNPEEPVTVRRWMAKVGAAVDDLVTIAQAEGDGQRLAAAVEAVRSSGAPLSVGDLAIGGKELMGAGIPEGPAVGAALQHLLDRAIEEPSVNTKERLLALVTDPDFPRSALRVPRTSSKGKPGT